jgi:uncharacterized protein YjiS (DUF1127 family)
MDRPRILRLSARLAARTRRELHELSDQRLRDLGLLRSQINERFR